MTEVHEVGTIQKLVDLNADHTVFDADIKVWSDDQDQEFQIAIADQTQIDNSQIDYKTVKGGVEVNIKNDDGIFRNHYVALKANNDIKLNVDIRIQPIQKKKVSFSDKVDQIHDSTKPQNPTFKNRLCNFYHSIWFKIFVVCILVLLYLYFSEKKTSTPQTRSGFKLGF